MVLMCVGVTGGGACYKVVLGVGGGGNVWNDLFSQIIPNQHCTYFTLYIVFHDVILCFMMFCDLLFVILTYFCSCYYTLLCLSNL